MLKRLYTIVVFSTVLGGLLLAAGCGSKESAPVDPEVVKKELLDKVWVCESMFRRDIHGDTPVTLQLHADGTVSGSGGCNTFTGTYNLAGASLSFGPLASTKKMCGPAASEQEFSYLTFLSQISKFAVDGDELELFSSDQPSPMIFNLEGSGGLW